MVLEMEKNRISNSKNYSTIKSVKVNTNEVDLMKQMIDKRDKMIAIPRSFDVRKSHAISKAQQKKSYLWCSFSKVYKNLPGEYLSNV